MNCTRRHAGGKNGGTNTKAERRKKRRRTQVAGDELDPVEEEGTDTDALHVGHEDVEDPGGNDTFFAWFFRGDGPAGWLSGAAFYAEQVDVDTTLTVVLESLAHLARLRRPVLTLPLEPRPVPTLEPLVPPPLSVGEMTLRLYSALTLIANKRHRV